MSSSQFLVKVVRHFLRLLRHLEPELLGANVGKLRDGGVTIVELNKLISYPQTHLGQRLLLCILFKDLAKILYKEASCLS